MSNVSKLVCDMLWKRQNEIGRLEIQLANAEFQIARLMEHRAELREFVGRVAAGDCPILAVEADSILSGQGVLS